MTIEVHRPRPGIAEIVIDVPPVNALDVASWFALADAVTSAGRDPDTVVAVLRAEGRGFCAGVDIKEIQARGDEALVGVNRGCAAAFAAVYDCEVPVVAAVHGFCLGGGIGLVGNADVVIASDDATFGLPEVDRGALGAATHLARLVPQHRMRAMVYTAEPATAADLLHFGSVLEVVPKEVLVDALDFASKIAAKSPTIIRRAKESLNGIDPVDVKRSYRYEQGFTYELHVRGVADEQRAAFIEKRERGHEPVTDKRATLDEIVGQIESGMTIGIGGWGSRRKPMAVVRAILRSDLTDLTVVSYGGPDVGLLCAAGKVRKIVFGFVTLDSIPLDPHFRAARQAGTVEARELDEGMFYLGLLAAAQRIPFLPTRGGLGSDVLTVNPDIRTVRSPYPGPDGRHEELVVAPAIPLDAAFVHMNRADTHGNAQFLGPDPFFDDVFLGAARLRFVTAERVVEPGALTDEGPVQNILVHRLLVDAVVATPGGAHFTSCAPDYERDEEFQRQYVKAAGTPETWEEFRSRYLQVDEAGYQSVVRGAATGPV